MKITVDDFNMLDKEILVLNCKAFQKENASLRDSLFFLQRASQDLVESYRKNVDILKAVEALKHEIKALSNKGEVGTSLKEGKNE